MGFIATHASRTAGTTLPTTSERRRGTAMPPSTRATTMAATRSTQCIDASFANSSCSTPVEPAQSAKTSSSIMCITMTAASLAALAETATDMGNPRFWRNRTLSATVLTPGGEKVATKLPASATAPASAAGTRPGVPPCSPSPLPM